MIKLSWCLTSGVLALAMAHGAAAAVYTLSPAGISALDVTLNTPNNLFVNKVPTSEGVIYEIMVANNQLWSTQNLSWTLSGQGTLTGIPMQSGDRLALQYTLLSAPSASAKVAVSALINHTVGNGSGYIGDNQVLGGVGGNTVVVSSAVTDQTSTSVVGSMIFTDAQSAWPANGGTVRVLVSPAPGATIIGPGGSGAVPQIIWTNDGTRQTTLWQFRGSRGAIQRDWWWIHSAGVPGWKVVAMGDFNRDGSTDLVWQNDTTRQVTVWYQTGAGNSTNTGWNWINSAGAPGWRVVAATDLNRDGVPDIIWQNDTSRQVTVWYMGGAQGNLNIGWTWLNAAGAPGWMVVAAADFNRDGTPDLVWQNDASRQVTVWYMGGPQGEVNIGWNWLNAAGAPGWKVVAAPDVDRDGVPDIIWQNDASRQATVWYMGGAQGNANVGWEWIYEPPVPGWTITAGR